MTRALLLEAHGVEVRAPGGRTLIRELSMQLERGERAALVGRNGVGKSTLLQVLAGQQAPELGRVRVHGECVLVPQQLEVAAAGAAGLSSGQVRRRALESAWAQAPALLLLDEPSYDLDAAGQRWLHRRLEQHAEGLVVVSHDPQLLRLFQDFLVVSEAGCWHLQGGFDALLTALEREQQVRGAQHADQLGKLQDRVRRQQLDQRRLRRRADRGRIRAIDKGTPRVLLNQMRGAAQVQRARRSQVHDTRVLEAQRWAEVSRQALTTQLPLAAVVPQLPEPQGTPLVVCQEVGVRVGETWLFTGLSLSLERERLAVVGRNGIGKSTLLALLAGERKAQRGRVLHERPGRIGYIAQHANNWCGGDGLCDRLLALGKVSSLSAAATLLHAHRFPLALAQRPLGSLSPGERVRAALICLLSGPDVPELLVLDEPSHHLDLVGRVALERLLNAWRGGLIVASHDEALLCALRLERRLDMAPSHGEAGAGVRFT